MENEHLNIRANRDFAYGFGGLRLSAHIYNPDRYPKVVAVPGDWEWIEKPIEEVDGVARSSDTGMILSDAAAKKLMDDLWNAGVRPSEEINRSEIVGAVTHHLNDMRKLVEKSTGVEF